MQADDSLFPKRLYRKRTFKKFYNGHRCFFVCASALGLYHLEELMEQINILDIPKLAVRGILIYMACMAVYLSITYAVYHIRYTKGRQKVKKYYLHLKRVNRLYREEEQM